MSIVVLLLLLSSLPSMESLPLPRQPRQTAIDASKPLTKPVDSATFDKPLSEQPGAKAPKDSAKPKLPDAKVPAADKVKPENPLSQPLGAPDIIKPEPAPVSPVGEYYRIHTMHIAKGESY